MRRVTRRTPVKRIGEKLTGEGERRRETVVGPEEDGGDSRRSSGGGGRRPHREVEGVVALLRGSSMGRGWLRNGGNAAGFRRRPWLGDVLRAEEKEKEPGASVWSWGGEKWGARGWPTEWGQRQAAVTELD